MSEMLEELKQEADDLGIKYSPNIGESKLKEKIEAYYESKETSSKEIEKAIKENEAKEDEAKEKSETKQKPALSRKANMNRIAREAYENAKKTVVVTIIDNDQRVNNQTSTCKANWSNGYFDLGTRIFPLNEPIEIPQGFINSLKSVKIPHHVKNTQTGLSRTSERPRYTIQREDNLTSKLDH